MLEMKFQCAKEQFDIAVKEMKKRGKLKILPPNPYAIHTGEAVTWNQLYDWHKYQLDECAKRLKLCKKALDTVNKQKIIAKAVWYGMDIVKNRLVLQANQGTAEYHKGVIKLSGITKKGGEGVALKKFLLDLVGNTEVQANYFKQAVNQLNKLRPAKLARNNDTSGYIKAFGKCYYCGRYKQVWSKPVQVLGTDYLMAVFCNNCYDKSFWRRGTKRVEGLRP